MKIMCLIPLLANISNRNAHHLALFRILLLDQEARTTSKVLPRWQVRIFRALIASKEQRSKDRRSDDDNSHDKEDQGAEQ